MLAVSQMGKKIAGDSEEQMSSGGKKVNVKLHPVFHRRLKIIAAAQEPHAMELGELVEHVMADFMKREWEKLGKKWTNY